MVLKDFLTNTEATTEELIFLVSKMFGGKISVKDAIDVLWKAEKNHQGMNSVLEKLVFSPIKDWMEVVNENSEKYLSALEYWSSMHEYQKDALFSKEVNSGLRQNYLKIQEIRNKYGN